MIRWNYSVYYACVDRNDIEIAVRTHGDIADSTKTITKSYRIWPAESHESINLGIDSWEGGIVYRVYLMKGIPAQSGRLFYTILTEWYTVVRAYASQKTCLLLVFLCN